MSPRLNWEDGDSGEIDNDPEGYQDAQAEFAREAILEDEAEAAMEEIEGEFGDLNMMSD